MTYGKNVGELVAFAITNGLGWQIGAEPGEENEETGDLPYLCSFLLPPQEELTMPLIRETLALAEMLGCTALVTQHGLLVI